MPLLLILENPSGCNLKQKPGTKLLAIQFKKIPGALASEQWHKGISLGIRGPAVGQLLPKYLCVLNWVVSREFSRPMS